MNIFYIWISVNLSSYPNISLCFTEKIHDQESWGAELHTDLKVHPKAQVVYKGVNPNIDSYSAFFDNAKLGRVRQRSSAERETSLQAEPFWRNSLETRVALTSSSAGSPRMFV